MVSVVSTLKNNNKKIRICDRDHKWPEPVSKIHSVWPLTGMFVNHCQSFEFYSAMNFVLFILASFSQTLLTLSYYFPCTSWPSERHQTSQFLQGCSLPLPRVPVSLHMLFSAFCNALHFILHLLWPVPVVQFIYFISASLNKAIYTMLITNEYYRVIKSYQINEFEFEQTLGDNGGQTSLACCSPRDCRVGHDLVTE